MQCGLLLLLSFSKLGIYIAAEIGEDIPFQEGWDGWILEVVYFLENYFGTNDWQWHYV
jgi:hypothetical protein